MLFRSWLLRLRRIGGFCQNFPYGPANMSRFVVLIGHFPSALDGLSRKAKGAEIFLAGWCGALRSGGLCHLHRSNLNRAPQHSDGFLDVPNRAAAQWYNLRIKREVAWSWRSVGSIYGIKGFLRLWGQLDLPRPVEKGFKGITDILHACRGA